ncbi:MULTISPECIES: S-layer homology domain-containing protein [unclassified Lysinibacillus]|uniref:S-layer homology domain-containing protein n=1 Tax=unclassified Lysinibacillus TaxID=2636778 RepID=UPI0020123905|nr:MULTISPECIES: S-layer homology domain-containing protein [unclassified Lysinibacillus]MCL1695868.1 S-layer homology domain-containing protein [Lysinibacillus sp. BPa_S21]MCL1700953.1 S-layer homology domain-containing protein [Lysinibacillus sp. Bpr_S20]
MKTNRFYQIAMASALATSAIVIAPPANAASVFPDINSSTEEGKAVINLAQRGIISGYPDGTFKPANPITRTQAAKILAGILKLDTVHVKNPNFKDIKPGDANYGAIAALANAGIISGSNGYFHPTKNITRGQMSKMIVKGFKLPITNGIFIPFDDVNEGSEYEPYIKTLFANSITKGTTPTTFGTQSNVKRSQLATFVVRAENALGNATVFASQFKQDYIFASYGGIKPADDIFTWVEDEEEYMTDSITIKPLKEGVGKLVITGYKEDTEDFMDFFYLVHVKKVNGKLQATLEKVKEEDYAENLPLNLMESDLKFVPTGVSIQTADGQALSPELYSFKSSTNSATLAIHKNGQYILTFTNGQQQQTMAAVVDTNDFVRGIDLYQITDELTISSGDLKFEPTSVALEKIFPGPATVKASIKDKKVYVTPLAEGPAILHISGKNGETAYMYIEYQKIANKWAVYYDFMDDSDEY